MHQRALCRPFDFVSDELLQSRQHDALLAFIPVPITCCAGMAFLMRTLFVALAVTAVAADLPPLPDFTSLPTSCGSVLQVQEGDTCSSIA